MAVYQRQMTSAVDKRSTVVALVNRNTEIQAYCNKDTFWLALDPVFEHKLPSRFVSTQLAIVYIFRRSGNTPRLPFLGTQIGDSTMNPLQEKYKNILSQRRRLVMKKGVMTWRVRVLTAKSNTKKNGCLRPHYRQKEWQFPQSGEHASHPTEQDGPQPKDKDRVILRNLKVVHVKNGIDVNINNHPQDQRCTYRGLTRRVLSARHESSGF